jgi:threonine/homoserine/homoserine lactone efflux protein
VLGTDVLPLALAVALSPFAVVPAILLLLSPRGVASASAFLAGWFVGLVGSTLVVAWLGDLLPSREEDPAWVGWVRIALGVVLLTLAVQSWTRRGGPGREPPWMATLSNATPGRAVTLGLLLSVANPKILFLSIAAGLTISGATAPGIAVAATLVYAVVASSTVLIPIVASAVGGDRVVVPLTRVRDWLVRHNAAVMAVVLAALGVLVLVEGISGLRS